MAHQQILNSFGRLSEHGNVFWETMFKKLISKQPDVLKYFANTDMHHLYSMLSKSVTYIVLNSSTISVQSGSHFARIIQIHNTKYQIPKTYIKEWRDSVIETIQELDTELTQEGLHAWIEAIDILIEPIGIK